MFFNHHIDAGLKTRDDEVIESVGNFKYLGSWISDTEHDFKVRKASAWIARNKMKKIVELKAVTSIENHIVSSNCGVCLFTDLLKVIFHNFILLLW